MFGHKTESIPIRNWNFKARRPTWNRHLVVKQLELAFDYRNELVLIEQKRRDESNGVIKAGYPRLNELDDEIKVYNDKIHELEQQVKRRNQSQRSRTVTAEARAELKKLRKERAPRNTERKELRARAFKDEAHQHALKEVEERAHDAKLATRAAYVVKGLHWGSYLRAEESVARIGRGRPPHTRDAREFQGFSLKLPRDGKPFLAEHTYCGSLAVQVKTGTTWGQLCSEGVAQARVQVLPPPPGRVPGSKRSQIDRRAAICYLRVGSESRQNPIWAKVFFHLHRRPADDVLVKWVVLHRWFVGQTEKWEFQFVLANKYGWAKGDESPDGHAGIDVNWRSFKGKGLRVATLVDEFGHEEEFFLPADHLTAWEKAQSLQSIRDREFDWTRGVLLTWLAAPKLTLSSGLEVKATIPEWLTERTKFLAHWKSHRGLTRLLVDWSLQRFAADGAIFDHLVEWARQERRLENWEAHMKKTASRRRDDLYRVFAARIRRSYKTIVLEDVNFRELNQKNKVEDKDNSIAREYPRIAAPGTLHQYLREAAADPLLAPPEYTTMKCHVCGEIQEFDQAKEVRHTCTDCGAEWDQDRNAAINLLRFVLPDWMPPGQSSGPGDPPAAPPEPEPAPVPPAPTNGNGKVGSRKKSSRYARIG